MYVCLLWSGVRTKTMDLMEIGPGKRTSNGMYLFGGWWILDLADFVIGEMGLGE